ncbi:hypothetical protein BV20DRAFT_785239 [Pilatotrama ljubarskyi]|nr:hypothetical protein BV20DRAFT_785239 [Pilatotrama ljubarskyi]
MPGISDMFLAASPRGLKTLGLDLSAADSSEFTQLLDALRRFTCLVGLLFHYTDVAWDMSAQIFRLTAENVLATVPTAALRGDKPTVHFELVSLVSLFSLFEMFLVDAAFAGLTRFDFRISHAFKFKNSYGKDSFPLPVPLGPLDRRPRLIVSDPEEQMNHPYGVEYGGGLV